jgi:hypothetical protein
MRHVVRREELYKLIWSEPATAIAARYGISSVALAKIARKLSVPVPPRGYWARKAAGQSPRRPPLPKQRDGAPAQHEIVPPPPRPEPPKRAPEIEAALEREQQRDAVVVPEQLADDAFHPLIQRSLKTLRRRKLDADIWRERRCIAVRVGPEMLERALRVMHVLLVQLDARGLRVEVRTPETRGDPHERESPRSRTIVHVSGELLEIAVAEHFVNVRVEEPPAINAKKPRWRKPVPQALHQLYEARIRYEERFEGVLRLVMRSADGKARVQFRDDAKHRVEDRLGRFLASFYEVADDLRREREEAARREKQRQEDERKRWEQAERQRRHEALVKDAEQRTRDLQFARSLRALAQEVEARLARQGPLADEAAERAWIGWAQDLADRVEEHVLTTVGQAWAPPKHSWW